MKTISEKAAAALLEVPRATLGYWRRNNLLPAGVLAPKADRPSGRGMAVLYDEARILQAVSGEKPIFRPAEDDEPKARYLDAASA